MKPNTFQWKIPVIVISGILFSCLAILLFFFIWNHAFPHVAFTTDLWGKVPLCNRNINRAIQIGDFVFPLCIRCTSMGCSFFIGILLLFMPKITNTLKKHPFYMWAILSIILMIPLVVDGIKVYFFQIDSPNLMRYITGILFGCGTSLLTRTFLIQLEKH